MEPTSCSAGLKEGSSIMLGSMSVSIGVVSIIPLSAINISISNPSMGLEVALNRASNGQNETKSKTATTTTGVERPDGDIGADELLVVFSTEVFLSFVPVIEFGLLFGPSVILVVAIFSPFSSFTTTSKLSSSACSVVVSKNGSRLASQHVVIVAREENTGNDSVGSFCRHRPSCCDFPSVDTNVTFCTDRSRLSVVKSNDDDRHVINNSIGTQSFTPEGNTTIMSCRRSDLRAIVVCNTINRALSYDNQSMSYEWSYYRYSIL